MPRLTYNRFYGPAGNKSPAHSRWRDIHSGVSARECKPPLVRRCLCSAPALVAGVYSRFSATGL